MSAFKQCPHRILSGSIQVHSENLAEALRKLGSQIKKLHPEALTACTGGCTSPCDCAHALFWRETKYLKAETAIYRNCGRKRVAQHRRNATDL